MRHSSNTAVTSDMARSDLADFIGARDLPCVGPKSALAKRQITTIMAGNFNDATHDRRVVAQLQEFAAGVSETALFVSVVVLFSPDGALAEPAFEQALWRRLQAWHEVDRRRFDWDSRVSSDPSSPTFSMSIGGQTFYVIGLHPSSSRLARRFPRPALVFNLHQQFERLSAEGRYDDLSRAITERDIVYSGSSNPMLARHGQSSEARQYSGREVDATWTCPLHCARSLSGFAGRVENPKGNVS